jgi:hypothetical protein
MPNIAQLEDLGINLGKRINKLFESQLTPAISLGTDVIGPTAKKALEEAKLWAKENPAALAELKERGIDTARLLGKHVEGQLGELASKYPAAVNSLQQALERTKATGIDLYSKWAKNNPSLAETLRQFKNNSSLAKALKQLKQEFGL